MGCSCSKSSVADSVVWAARESKDALVDIAEGSSKALVNAAEAVGDVATSAKEATLEKLYDLVAPVTAHVDELVEAGLEVPEESVDEMLSRVTTGTLLIKGVDAGSLSDDGFGGRIEIVVKMIFCSFYTHCGIVVRSPPADLLELYKCPPDESGTGVYLFESTLSMGGAALRPLTHVLGVWGASYGITEEERERDTWVVCMRTIVDATTREPALGGVHPALSEEALFAWIREAHGKGYGITMDDLASLCKWYLSGRCSTREEVGDDAERREFELKSLFCTELVAESMMRFGALTEKYPANQYLPLFFAPQLPAYDVGDEAVERNFTPGLAYGPMTRVVSGCAKLVHAELARQAKEAADSGVEVSKEFVGSK